jgi:hypothetical protein
MHLVVDPVRPGDLPPPTAHHPLTVAKRPELSNVAEVARSPPNPDPTPHLNPDPNPNPNPNPNPQP